MRINPKVDYRTSAGNLWHLVLQKAYDAELFVHVALVAGLIFIPAIMLNETVGVIVNQKLPV